MSEPTRLPVSLRAWGSGNKVCALIAMAMLALVGPAFAKIGETPQTVIARSQGNKDIIGIRTDYWQGKKPIVYVHYRDGAVVDHVFGQTGREIAMCSVSPKRFSPKDVVDIQHLYPGTWRGTGVKDGIYSWVLANRLEMTAQRCATFDLLTIVDLNAPLDLTQYAVYLNKQATPPTPAAPQITEEKNDCLLVATEAHARLRNSAAWSKIVAFTWIGPKESTGHAVVFYQPTQDSDVFMYDKTLGSLDLGTQSHDLMQLVDALNQILQRTNSRVQNPRWIGGN